MPPAIMSDAKLRRLAAAEAGLSTAVGTVGVNEMLLNFYRQSEAKKAKAQDTQVETRDGRPTATKSVKS